MGILEVDIKCAAIYKRRPKQSKAVYSRDWWKVNPIVPINNRAVCSIVLRQLKQCVPCNNGISCY